MDASFTLPAVMEISSATSSSLLELATRMPMAMPTPVLLSVALASAVTPRSFSVRVTTSTAPSAATPAFSWLEVTPSAMTRPMAAPMLTEPSLVSAFWGVSLGQLSSLPDSLLPASSTLLMLLVASPSSFFSSSSPSAAGLASSPSPSASSALAPLAPALASAMASFAEVAPTFTSTAAAISRLEMA